MPNKLWEWLNQPLLPQISTLASKAADKIDEPQLDENPAKRLLLSFLAGATKGAGDLGSSLTSPLNLGVSALGLGAEKAAAEGMMGISAGARGLEALAQTPLVAEGVSNAADSNKSVGERAAGVLEALGGIGGMHVAGTHAFSPQAVAEAYAAERGLPAPTPHTPVKVDPTFAKRVADSYDAMVHNPNDPATKAAYSALSQQTQDQFNFMTKRAGLQVEPWKSEGQPYANSAAMLNDVKQNNHLFYFPSEQGFGMDPAAAGNPLLKPGENNQPVNDLFRAVHDYFGHAAQGHQFGPNGEENAFLEHSKLFTPEAQPALQTETRGQNSWVNFGPHMRDAEGNLLKKGDPGWLPQTERPFAAQKTGLLPDGLSKAEFAQKMLENPTLLDAFAPSTGEGFTNLEGTFRPPMSSFAPRQPIPTDTRMAELTQKFGGKAVQPAINRLMSNEKGVLNFSDLIKGSGGKLEFRAGPMNKIEQAVRAGEGTADNWAPLANHLGAFQDDPEAAKMFSRFWGATSPNTPVGRNNYEALQAWKQMLEGNIPFDRAKALAANLTMVNAKVPNLNRALEGRPLQGSRGEIGKTEAMSQLVFGDKNAVPIDVHALSGVGAPEDSVGQIYPALREKVGGKPSYTDLYNSASDIYRKALDKFGVGFPQFWEGVKKLKGQGESAGMTTWLKKWGLLEPGQMVNIPTLDHVIQNVDPAEFYGRELKNVQVKAPVLYSGSGPLGVLTPKEKMLDLEHRSPRTDLTEADPSFYGSGSAGAEKARVGQPDWANRVYATIKGEPVEGRFRAMPTYDSQVPERVIYPLDNDPLGLVQKAQQSNDPRTAIEKLVRDMGFKGYSAQGQVAYFDKLPLRKRAS